MIPSEVQSLHLRPDKDHHLTFHWRFETHLALFTWRAKATTIETVSPNPTQHVLVKKGSQILKTHRPFEFVVLS